MQLNRYATLAAALPLSFAALAQITLVSPGNVPVPGNAFTVHRGAYTAPPATTPGGVFNYAALTSDTMLTYQWRNPAELPNGSSYPGAQFALVNGGPDTAFYKANPDGIERIGDTQKISALGTDYHLATGFSNSILELKLTLTYGDAPWTDFFQGTFTADGHINTRNGAITGSASGWGYIVMPGGADTVPVLRVTTRITETIPLATGLGPLIVNHKHNEDSYYPLWGKFPVLRTVSDTLDATLLQLTKSYTEWLDGGVLAVAAMDAPPFGVQVFPNPASGKAYVVSPAAGNSPVDLQVLDTRGAVVLHMQNKAGIVEVDTEQLGNGVYQVLLTGKDGRRGTARLVVAH